NNPATVGPGSADLELVKTAPSGVQANHELTYTLSVTNHGPSDAVGLSLTDSIPAGTTFVRTNLPANWTCSHTSLAVVCNDSTHLAPGATDTLLIVLLVGNLSNGTTVTNNAVVSATTADPGLFTNTDDATTTVSNNFADLGVVKSASPGTVVAGNAVTYTITATNTGPSNAASVVLTDTLPAGTTFASV